MSQDVWLLVSNKLARSSGVENRNLTSGFRVMNPKSFMPCIMSGFKLEKLSLGMQPALESAVHYCFFSQDECVEVLSTVPPCISVFEANGA